MARVWSLPQPILPARHPVEPLLGSAQHRHRERLQQVTATTTTKMMTTTSTTAAELMTMTAALMTMTPLQSHRLLTTTTTTVMTTTVALTRMGTLTMMTTLRATTTLDEMTMTKIQEYTDLPLQQAPRKTSVLKHRCWLLRHSRLCFCRLLWRRRRNCRRLRR